MLIKTCRKLRRGEVPYAPLDVQLHCKLFHLWNLVVKKLCGKKISARLIKRQAKKCKIEYPILMSLSEAKEKQKEAMQAYLKATPSAKEKRDNFIEYLASSCEKAGNDKAALQVRTMRKQEYRRAAQREVKLVITPFNEAKVMHVEVEDPEEPNGVRKITDKSEMEAAVMADHFRKYTEFYNTPPLMEPQKSIVGPFGMTVACKLIIQGKYALPPVIHPDIVEFLII